MKKIAIKLSKVCLVLVFVALLVFCFENKTKSVVYAESQINKQAYQILNEKSKKLYKIYEERTNQIISGTEVKSYFSISQDNLNSLGFKTSWSSSELGSANFNFDYVDKLFSSQIESKKIMLALNHDFPFELFWFDKVGGIVQYVKMNKTSTKIDITSLEVVMSVSKDYQIDGYNNEQPQVNSEKVLLSKSVLDNAKMIVSKYESLSDYQKLVAYKNEICELVSYNNDAASSSYTGGYGDPWQVVYVFDNNSSTNVVCEGYAKAFQLLCDLTTFNNNIACYTVSGVMTGATGAGNHMWNVVHMDDENSYLVDITNSDSGTVGSAGGLFLSGYSLKEEETGYTFNLDSAVTYKYAESTEDLWKNNSQAILDIASSNYQEEHPVIKIIQDSNLTYDGEGISVGLNGSETFDIYFEFEDDIDESLYNWSVEYYLYSDGFKGDKLTLAPIDAGEYWLKVTATNKVLQTEKICSGNVIFIKPKQVSMTDIVVNDKKYNNSSLVSLNEALIGGVIGDDEVYVLKDELIVNALGINVGTYNVVNIENIKLGGVDKNNYLIENTINNFNTNEFEIKKAKPSLNPTFLKVKAEGKTLNDINFVLVAKGINNEVVEGTYTWIDESGNNVDLNKEIIKDKKYWFKFTPSNSNYEETTDFIIPWGKGEFNIEKELPNIITYALYGIGALLIITCLVITIKKKKNNKK